MSHRGHYTKATVCISAFPLRQSELTWNIWVTFPIPVWPAVGRAGRPVEVSPHAHNHECGPLAQCHLPGDCLVEHTTKQGLVVWYTE